MTIITPMFLTGSLTHICISKNIGVLEMIQSVIFKKVILINDNILLRLLEPKKNVKFVGGNNIPQLWTEVA